MDNNFNKKSYILGIVTGVAIIIVLGGVFLAGAKSGPNSGGFLAQARSAPSDTTVNQQPQPTVAPTAAPTQPSPSQPNIGTVKPVDAKDHVRGSANAKVTLIEYSDLECPFCKRFHPTMQQVMTDYKGQVAWVYRHYPLSFHQNAAKEAEATECVNELGGNTAFWKYVDLIFERTTSNGTGIALTQLGPMAKEVGVSQDAFQTCLDSGKYASLVAQEEQDGQSSGVSGTPGTFVIDKNGKQQYIPGALPYEQVKPIIDSLL